MRNMIVSITMELNPVLNIPGLFVPKAWKHDVTSVIFRAWWGCRAIEDGTQTLVFALCLSVKVRCATCVFHSYQKERSYGQSARAHTCKGQMDHLIVSNVASARPSTSNYSKQCLQGYDLVVIFNI